MRAPVPTPAKPASFIGTARALALRCAVHAGAALTAIALWGGLAGAQPQPSPPPVAAAQNSWPAAFRVSVVELDRTHAREIGLDYNLVDSAGDMFADAPTSYIRISPPKPVRTAEGVSQDLGAVLTINDFVSIASLLGFARVQNLPTIHLLPLHGGTLAIEHVVVTHSGRRVREGVRIHIPPTPSTAGDRVHVEARYAEYSTTLGGLSVETRYSGPIDLPPGVDVVALSSISGSCSAHRRPGLRSRRHQPACEQEILIIMSRIQTPPSP